MVFFWSAQKFMFLLAIRAKLSVFLAEFSLFRWVRKCLANHSFGMMTCKICQTYRNQTCCWYIFVQVSRIVVLIQNHLSSIRPGQKKQNQKTEPKTNWNTLNWNWTENHKYPNGSYISIFEITEPNRTTVYFILNFLIF